jgi:hypothetical protein
MDIHDFVNEKRDEILALASRYRASDIRLVKPTASDPSIAAEEVVRLVATFSHDVQRSNYFDVLAEFQEDLEAWLGVKVHVYDANGFKGADGEAFLKETVAL